MKALRVLAFVLASLGSLCTCGGVALLFKTAPGIALFAVGFVLLVAGTVIGVWTEER